jgi:hypothetical protein
MGPGQQMFSLGVRRLRTDVTERAFSTHIYKSWRSEVRRRSLRVLPRLDYSESGRVIACPALTYCSSYAVNRGEMSDITEDTFDVRLRTLGVC